jgi:hypothetical protein
MINLKILLESPCECEFKPPSFLNRGVNMSVILFENNQFYVITREV